MVLAGSAGLAGDAVADLGLSGVVGVVGGVRGTELVDIFSVVSVGNMVGAPISWFGVDGRLSIGGIPDLVSSASMGYNLGSLLRLSLMSLITLPAPR